MKKNLRKIKIRELTKNEKILLFILSIVVLFYLSSRFIYRPQKEKLMSLNTERIKYESKIEEINSTLRMENSLNKEWQDLNKEKEGIASQYFPTLDQTQILYILNDLIEDDEFTISNINFNKPEINNLGDFQIKSMDILIPYLGKYEAVVETLKFINKSPRKIIIDNLHMDRTIDKNLSGNMCLRIYSLEGIVESEKDIIYINTAINEEKDTPFSAYEEYKEEEILETEQEGEDFELDDKFQNSEVHRKQQQGLNDTKADSYVVESLLDFENKSNYFIPSQEYVKGDVSLSTNSKSKKYSLKLEYNILAVEEENRAFIDVRRNNVLIKYPPNKIGIWVYSYDYSPATIGLGFRGQMGEDISVTMGEGIGWTGWKYLEASPPSELDIYPIKLESLYLEIPKDREDYGIILFDKLEAIYNRNLGQDGNDMSIANHIFHVVEKGESIEEISKLYYGTNMHKNEIMELNEIKPGEVLHVGKILVLKKP